MKTETHIPHASPSLPPPIGSAGSTSEAGVTASGFCYYCRQDFSSDLTRVAESGLAKVQRKLGYIITEPLCHQCCNKMHSGKLHPDSKRSSLVTRDNLKSLLLGLSNRSVDPISAASSIINEIVTARAELASTDAEIEASLDEIKLLTERRNETLRLVLEVEWFFKRRDGESYSSRRLAANRIIGMEMTRLKIFSRDGYRCVYCGCKKNLTVDHVVAVKRGGDNDIMNLQTLCKTCNSRKGARPWGKYSELNGKKKEAKDA